MRLFGLAVSLLRRVSNVTLVCPNCGPARVGYKVAGDTKVRICKKCGQELPTKK